MISTEDFLMEEAEVFEGPLSTLYYLNRGLNYTIEGEDNEQSINKD